MRESLAPFVQVLSPGADQVRQIQDKRAVLRLAHQVGISCPKTYMLQDGEDLEEVARTISYPAVLKPRFSHYRRDGGWTKGSVEYASDPQDLKAKYRDLHAQIPFPLVQERIYGEGRGVFILLWEGQLVAAFCHRRIREKPPWGGVSVLSESVPLDRTLVERSYALLRASGWQGVAMVEFKLDEEDRQPKLMEVNGRFWGSLQLAIDAGINFPLLLYRLAGGASVPAQLEYTVGARSRWFLGDLDSLLIRLTHRRTPVPFPDGKDSRLKACWKFLKLFERNLRYEVLRVEDPGPGWLECKEYIAATVKNLLTRSKVS
jgi:predicted ATP-grasp superfamily ATP-dependent carboligase